MLKERTSSSVFRAILKGCLGLTVVAMLFAAGCGGGSATVPMVAVTGTVTFDGAPVEEGVVTFEDTATGYAATGDLAAGGAYTLQVPAGSYQVGIAPPTVEVAATADTPADEDYKKVDNIPEKYWYGYESGLTATVSNDAVTFDFDMQP